MTFLAIVVYFLYLHVKWDMKIWTFGNTSRTRSFAKVEKLIGEGLSQICNPVKMFGHLNEHMKLEKLNPIYLHIFQSTFVQE